MSSTLWRSRRRGERPVIYGRERERVQLRELLDDTVAGHGSLVLIGGEAGIGKTTLVEDLNYQAEQRDCLVLTGSCYDLTTTPPYGPWTEITRQYLEQDDLPPLPTQLREGAGMEDIPSQVALFELVSSFLVSVAERQPLVLLLEDLHWSDAESLALLRHVSRSIRDHPIMIIASYRNDEITRRHRLAQLLPRLVRESRAERIDLHQLDAVAIGELIQDRYELEKDDEERLATYLEDRSEGNPLYVEELLYTLESEETLTQSSNGSWSLGRLEAVPVPMLIVQLIEDRLGNLEERTRELLEILALIGHEVEIDLWRRVTEADDVELIEATRQALERRIVVETTKGTHLQFHHALIREALTSGLIALERQAWHRRIADILIESPHPDPDAVVTHLERADDPRLIEWLTKAGERAKEQLAWDVAVERFEYAVRILNLQRDADSELLCDLLLALGSAQGFAGSSRGNAPGTTAVETARMIYWKAVEVARAIASPLRLAKAALGVAWGGDVPFSVPLTDKRIIALLEEVLERLPEEDSTERALTEAGLAVAYRNFKMYSARRFEAGSEARIEQLSAAALAMAIRLGDRSVIAMTRSARRFAISHPSRVDEMQTLTDELFNLERLDEFHVLYGQADALIAQFFICMSRGELARSKQLINEIAILYEETRTPRHAASVNMSRAGMALNEGRFADAGSFIEEINTNWPNTGAACNLTFALCREQDRLQDAERCLDSILRVFPRSPWFSTCWILYLLESGDVAGARQLFSDRDIDDLADLARGNLWPHVLAICAELSVTLEDPGRARTCYELLEPYPDQIIYSGYIHFCGGSISHYLGLLSGFLGEWQNVEDHFQHALEQHQSMGFHPLVAHTQHAWARMLLQRGRSNDQERASDLLDQATETAERLGMIRLQRLIGETRDEFGPADASFPYGLSQREVEVLRLVVEGMTDGEIAEALYLSPRTISTYLSSIYNKLGVNSRAAAAAITVRSGLA